MSRYIDAEWVNHEYYKNPSYENLCHALNNAPTADVKPVVRGEWIEHDGYSECGLCGRLYTLESNYCPNCGARMVEE